MTVTLFSLAALLALAGHAAAAPRDAWRFDFSAVAAAGAIAVRSDMPYSAARGFGFEPSPAPGAKPFLFSADVPEGNHAVTITFGGTREPASATVKAELRRLMLERVPVAAGATVTRTFIVNTRTPRIAGGGAVDLKAPRETVQEAWNWDGRLTLELHGPVRTIEIRPARVPTLFLLGDSTVCDQPQEPYASWGQMLPRFFRPTIAVANHGESGETYRDSLARRRLDKIASLLRPGDTVLLQFGHNDQKQLKQGNGSPATYKAELRAHVEAIRARGGEAVVLSPMERRAFDADGKVIGSLSDYAAAAREAAHELHVPFIDLNAASKPMYEALGVEGSKAAFAQPAPGKVDNTHHNNYGAYQLAKAVVAGLRAAGVSAAAHVVDGFAFDPARPDSVAAFAVPASPNHTNERPLGDEAHP
ncbi:rhamnogalacturonan acetylesterase [Pseudoduganella chitinolytica]|uniref:Rhamnogalacturonan acetylesterase n=1 Tax=Pseudoduganella chitinolytica TaxID=34070 RepID=A0ABY8B459_9BURK|nr:rhamnogalacturonan acetylesterase [Pseudoduganella chitinolytica]WEF30720.1 rhamnogalacturonan acetylesterase [Pseudoduganella chitinolytica]